MRYPSQPNGRSFVYRCEISRQNEIFAPVQQPGWTHAGLSRPIFWWCHINKCRPKRGNRIELAPVRKSPRYHMNTPSSNYFDVFFSPQVRNVSDSSSNNLKIPLDSQNEEVVSNVSSLPLFFFFHKSKVLMFNTYHAKFQVFMSTRSVINWAIISGFGRPPLQNSNMAGNN